MSEHSKEKDQAPSHSPETPKVAVESYLVQVVPSINARYDALIIRSYKVPKQFNLLAVLFLWILLAGCVVFPATFPSLLRSSALGSSSSGRLVQRAIQSIPLLVFAIVCFVLGMIGIGWLWRKRRHDYFWLMDRLFLPGCLNALAGLIAAVVNVQFARDGHWSKPAVATSVIMGTCVLVLATLYVAYRFVIVPREVQNQEPAEQKDVPAEQTA